MPTKKRLQYRYTPTGQRSLLIDPDGGRFTYTYDSLKRLTQVINPQAQRTTFGYDAAGRRTVKKLASGSRTSFSYDLASRLTSVTQLKSDVSVQAQYQYKYDKVGNRLAMAESGHTTARTTWSYDAAYQLTGEHRTGANAYRNTYVYDTRGNRTLKNLDGARTTSSYDDANQLKWTDDGSGRTTYTFDADGNQQVVLTPAGQRTTSVWDYENKLTGVLNPAGTRETMAYDPDGRRVKHQTASETAKYVWDQENYLAETNASDVTQVVYTNEPKTYGNLISQRKSGATHYYVFDALGSTRLLTDSSEAVAESLLYDAWGNLVGSAPTLSVPFRWVGELGYLFVPASGDYSVRARIFRPTIGRWLSQDPMEFSDGLNRLTYAHNTPTGIVDPRGRWTLLTAATEYCRRRCLGIEKGPDFRWRYRECRDACYQRLNETMEEIFSAWYELEMEDLSKPHVWTSNLHLCPCSLILCSHDGQIEIAHPGPTIWNDPGVIGSHTAPYHPGAVYEMRSKPNFYGASRQCTYDAQGKLIMAGSGAGTADRFSPTDPVQILRHIQEDVTPYEHMLQLCKLEGLRLEDCVYARMYGEARPITDKCIDDLGEVVTYEPPEQANNSLIDEFAPFLSPSGPFAPYSPPSLAIPAPHGPDIGQRNITPFYPYQPGQPLFPPDARLPPSSPDHQF